MKRNSLFVFIFSIVLFFLISCSERNDPRAGRIVVVGMDALDLKIIHELIEQHRLPTFQRLMEKGTWGKMRSYNPMLSPMIWTTLATGRTPDEHGILDFTSLDANGNPIAVPSSKRKCSALWNILSTHGKSCTVIGWFATWPAETIQGVMVSDRFAPSLFLEKQDPFEDFLPNLTFPEKLAYTEVDLRKNYTQIGYSELSPYLHISEEDCQKILASPFTVHNRVHHLRLVLARTETYASVLLDCLKNHASDLTLSYFDGTDSVPHLFMQERAPRQPDITDEDFTRFSNAVDAMYERMDHLLKDVLDQLDERDTLVVISDHGFRSGEERLKRSSLTTMGPAVSWHREEGTLLAYGPSIQPGEIQDSSVFDIAPTLLAMLGIAPSQKMPGKVLPELVGGTSQAELTRVADLDAGYHPPALPAMSGKNAGFNSEELQSLGYAAAHSKQTEDGKWENINEYFNLGVYYEHKGEYEKALQEVDHALSIDPNHRLVLGTRCRILVRTQQYEKAEPEITRLKSLLNEEISAAEAHFSKSDHADDTLNDDLIRAQIDNGRVGLSEIDHIQGEMEYQRSHFEKAAECFSQSLEFSPDNTETMYNLGTCYGITGQYEKSVEILTRLLEIDPLHQKGRQSLAVAYLRLKRGSLALPLLESLDRETPNDANLHYLMGEAYRVEQDFENAREHYKKALQIAPDLMKAKQKLELMDKGN